MSVLLTSHVLKRILGIIFTLYKTVSLEIFNKAAASTLVQINFGRKITAFFRMDLSIILIHTVNNEQNCHRFCILTSVRWAALYFS